MFVGKLQPVVMDESAWDFPDLAVAPIQITRASHVSLIARNLPALVTDGLSWFSG